MDRTEIWLSALLKLVFQSISVVVASIVTSWALSIVARFDTIALWIIGLLFFILCTVLTVAILYIPTKKVAFKAGFSNRKASWISSGLAILVHWVLGLAFFFAPFWSGGSVYLSGVLIQGAGFMTRDVIIEQYFLPTFLVALIPELICGVVMSIAEQRGALARRKERLEMTGNPEGVAPLIAEEDREKSQKTE
ncbi:MAG: hypothetical protein IKS35_01620 [Clostridia bacterium]|nr:hypothetical protein [Clostridia bacterium]